MALTYEELGALSTDLPFRQRIKIAQTKWTSYVRGEAATVEAHSARYRYAIAADEQPEMYAAKIQTAVVMDPAVQADGAAVTDAALQSAVEGVINKIL